MARYECVCGEKWDDIDDAKCPMRERGKEAGICLDSPMDIVEEFEALFFELTGIMVENAIRQDGWLFIPPQSGFASTALNKRTCLVELANNNWKNYLVDGKYAGCWILPPSGRGR